MSRKIVSKSLADGLVQQRLHEENQLWFSNSRHFRFYWTKEKKITEWYFTTKPWDWETCREKIWKIVRIMSLNQLGSRRAMQLLIFLSCLSPGRVKKLQKFINSCLKVGHSANLKQSKSTCKWRALGTMHAQHFLIAEREWYRFDIGLLRAEPTNYEFTYTRLTRLHIAVSTIIS